MLGGGGGGGGLAAKEAVTERFAVTFRSVREALVFPSDQEVKWNPLLATALTALPFAPELTVCGDTPDIDPPEAAV